VSTSAVRLGRQYPQIGWPLACGDLTHVIITVARTPSQNYVTIFIAFAPKNESRGNCELDFGSSDDVNCCNTGRHKMFQNKPKQPSFSAEERAIQADRLTPTVI